MLLTALKVLEQDPSGEGFSHLDMDGVFRNFGKDGKVWSYRTLNPEEIKEMVTCFRQTCEVSSRKNWRVLMDGTSRT